MNAADTGFVIICATLVMLMTPALALFYGGLVRARNVLSTNMHSYASLGLITALWAIAGYSLAFGADWHGLIGNLDYVFLRGVEGSAAPLAPNLPHTVYVAFQCMFAVLTVALVSGAYAERIRFKAMLTFSALWLFCAYVPMAHWVWGAAGWPSLEPWTSPAALWCTWLPGPAPWPARRRLAQGWEADITIRTTFP